MVSQAGLEQYIAGNRNFVKSIKSRKPDFFDKLASSQAPEVLWIGCADSRVPETTILDKDPGDVFVHRNVANIVQADDPNADSVIHFAVTVVKVKRIVVCGHTNCRGAMACLGEDDLGSILNGWLQPLRELRRKHQAEIDGLASEADKAIRLAELNVKQALYRLKQKESVAGAIDQGVLEVHGAIYDVASGVLRALE